MFPRLYETIACPIDGYAGYVFRVLLNPTGAEKTDWAFGHMGVEGCAECAALVGRGKPKADEARRYCATCQQARERLGRAAVAVYGTSEVQGFDFSTMDAALATFAMPDLPDELLAWLYMLPVSLWNARAEDLKKKLTTSAQSHT